jgi:hypothetical protein
MFPTYPIQQNPEIQLFPKLEIVSEQQESKFYNNNNIGNKNINSQIHPIYAKSGQVYPDFYNHEKFTSYKIWSICNVMSSICFVPLTLLCSVPALIYSYRTEDNFQLGNIGQAKASSQDAKLFNWVSTILTFFFTIIVVYAFFEFF